MGLRVTEPTVELDHLGSVIGQDQTGVQDPHVRHSVVPHRLEHGLDDIAVDPVEEIVREVDRRVAAHPAGVRTGIAVAISCVGRRLVLSRQTEEEVEAVRDTLGSNFYLTGYYSYGELAPFADFIKCQLHNQTMTLTTISE